MAQISKGQTFSNGDQVTGTTLNQLVDAATLLGGSITEQIALSGAVEGADQLAIYDNSSGGLRKTTVTDILNSATTASLSTLTVGNLVGQANSEINLTPYAGVTVTGKAWASIDGALVTVTSTAHGLSTGQILTFTSSNSAYSGTYIITVTTVDAFTYTINPTSTAASGTVSYIRVASFNVNGTTHLKGNVYVDGNLKAGATEVTSLSIGGKTPMTTQDNLNKVYVKSGTASGATGAGTDLIVYQTPTLTIPSDETWIYNFSVQTTSGYVNGSTRPDYGYIQLKVYNNTTLLTTLIGSSSPYGGHTATLTSTKAFTSADSSPKLILKIWSLSGLNIEPVYVVTLTKVKTSTLSDASSCI